MCIRDSSNVGDSAIWMGELVLLGQLTGRAPAYVCTTRTYDAKALRLLCPEGPIFIHGGGNFGDIWPEHQRFRESLLREFPDRDLVQLPQTIKYRNSAKIQTFVRASENHGRFHLYVRDVPSLDFATDNLGCPVDLLPDCAFAMGLQSSTQRPDHAVIMLMRTDVERVAFDFGDLPDQPDVLRIDWLAEPRHLRRRLRIETLMNGMIKGVTQPSTYRRMLFERLARARVRRGLDLLSRGDVVITDRLHAHILSLLLNKRHVFLDNNYGKITGYHQSWTKNVDIAVQAENEAQAMAAAAQMA